MSADALKAVIGDESPVPPGVQAVLLAIAWKTPSGTDRSSALTYQDIAGITRQSTRTISRCILEGITRGALELVWAKYGDPRGTRYRVNRGTFYVPTDPEEISTALAYLTGVAPDDPRQFVQGSLDDLSGDPRQIDQGAPDRLSGDPRQIGTPLLKKEQKENGEVELPAALAALDNRLQEKGHYQRD